MTIDEIMEALRSNGDNDPCFDSEYTKRPSDPSARMFVDSQRLFRDLSPEQRQHYATKDKNGTLTLDLRNCVYAWYPYPIEDWILIYEHNPVNPALGFKPFVKHKHFVIDVNERVIHLRFNVHIKVTNTLLGKVTP